MGGDGGVIASNRKYVRHPMHSFVCVCGETLRMRRDTKEKRRNAMFHQLNVL
jgi:hypothetical protein